MFYIFKEACFRNVSITPFRCKYMKANFKSYPYMEEYYRFNEAYI